MKEGISIVICCHNGASRLPETLKHLKAQEPPRVPWEIVLIDNASNDDTAVVAQAFWRDAPVPLRVILERRLGTRYARERGFAEASYSLIGFVDDDNWLAPDWIRMACEIMQGDPRIAAVSGISTPVCDGPLPAWFDLYQSYYAVLTAQKMSSMRTLPLQLPTAGLCVRKAAWRELIAKGFRSLVAGRAGKNLAGGEDTELTAALRLSGWRLEVDPRLRLRHFMPRRRLEWTYLRRLARDNDASTVLLDGYADHSLSLRPGLRCWISEWWLYQLVRSVGTLSTQPRAVFAALTSPAPGRDDVIEVERAFGRILGLLRFKSRYREARSSIRRASWRNSTLTTLLEGVRLDTSAA